MNTATWLGLLVGLGAIVFGHLLEGGELASIIQGTAAAVVFGGTLGAVFVSHSWETIGRATSMVGHAFWGQGDPRRALAAEILTYAQLVRKESVLSLEKKILGMQDPFMKSVFRFVVDGVEPATIREIFENEIRVQEDRDLSAAKVFSDAGGYAPTIGIIGAVLGLIHVMQNLTDTSKLGSGIAVAFVATVYGVGSANLVFIPIASKIKRLVLDRSETKEMILVGALAIQAGVNPYITEEKMKPYLPEGRS